MIERLKNWRPFRSVQAFHKDERGLEALQVVMILAVALLVLLVLRQFAGQIIGYTKNLLDQFLS
jgi:hypothetical protein